MPLYDLNEQDVKIILDSLSYAASQAHSIEEHSVVMTLKNKLLHNLYSNNSTPNNEEIDVWSAFSSNK